VKKEAPVIVEEVKQDPKTKQTDPPKVEKQEAKKPEKKGWFKNLFSKEKSEPPSKKAQVNQVPQHAQQPAEEKPFMSMEEMIAADMMAMGEEPQPGKTQTKPAKPEAIPAPERKIIEKPEPLLKAKEPVFTKPEPIVIKPEPLVVKPEPVFAKASLEPSNFNLTEQQEDESAPDFDDIFGADDSRDSLIGSTPASIKADTKTNAKKKAELPIYAQLETFGSPIFTENEESNKSKAEPLAIKTVPLDTEEAELLAFYHRKQREDEKESQRVPNLMSFATEEENKRVKSSTVPPDLRKVLLDDSPTP